MDNHLDISIRELAALFRSKAMSPYEFLSATFDRIESREPELNAYVEVMWDEALEQARDMVFTEWDDGNLLKGIPYALKDLYMIKERPLTCGSPVMSGYIADKNALIYDRMKSHDALLLGKTNMNEFAAGYCHEAFGRTNNPVNTAYSAGGSSGGSAATIAAKAGLFSFGTDTGGSVRIPASYCGIMGFKPTRMAELLNGIFPLSSSLDHAGYFTKNIDDLIIVHSAVTDQWDFLADEKQTPARIAILKEKVLEKIDPVISQRYLDTVKKLSVNIVSDINFFNHEEILKVFSGIFYPEMSMVHSSLRGSEGLYRNETREMLEIGKRTPAIDYIAAKEKQGQLSLMLDQIFDSGIDLVLTPTVGIKVPMDEESDDFDIDNEMRFTLPLNITGNPALSINMGYDEAGLPIGLQVIGKRHQDMKMLKQLQDLMDKGWL